MNETTQRLAEKVQLRGIGTPMLATQVKKHEKSRFYIYKREDENFEVFRAKIKPKGEVFDKMYPEREIYPSNEDFGATAWCFTNLEDAEKRFDEKVLEFNKSEQGKDLPSENPQ